jgi:hypothetical protein
MPLHGFDSVVASATHRCDREERKDSAMGIWNEPGPALGGLFGLLVFFGYLAVLFMIIADLFRDSKIGGFGKAIWLLFLVFVPLLTGLVYLIARGSAMAARGREREARGREYVDDRGDTSQYNPNDEILKAQGLLGDGAISQAEFERIQQASMRE